MASLVTINSMQTRGGDGNEQDAPELLSKLPPVNIRVEDLKLGILFDRSIYLLVLVLQSITLYLFCSTWQLRRVVYTKEVVAFARIDDDTETKVTSLSSSVN